MYLGILYIVFLLIQLFCAERYIFASELSLLLLQITGNIRGAVCIQYYKKPSLPLRQGGFEDIGYWAMAERICVTSSGDVCTKTMVSTEISLKW